MNKQEWVEAVYLVLCKYQGAPANSNEEKNLREWAAGMADGPDGWFGQGFTPEEAYYEEMQCCG